MQVQPVIKGRVATPTYHTRNKHMFLESELKDFEVNGMKLRTGPLVPGVKMDILGITNNDVQLANGYHEVTDMLNPKALGLSRLYFSYKEKSYAIDLMWDRYLLEAQPQDNYRIIALTFEGLPLQLFDEEEFKMVHMNFSAKANTETGHFVFFGSLVGGPPDAKFVGADFHIERINLNRSA